MSESHSRELIIEIRNYLGRFISYPSKNALMAHSLWIMHTHLMDEWETTPRIVFMSPEPGSGKTRALEITFLLVSNPILSTTSTAGYIAREINNQSKRSTLLLDEIDSVFSDKKNQNEELRSILNGGYRKGAKVGKCTMVGKKITTEQLEIFSAVALASLNILPDTIADRSIIINMKKRSPQEKIESYRQRLEKEKSKKLKSSIEKWAKENSGIGKHYPDLPTEIHDRKADIWEPIITIADCAGKKIGQEARETAINLTMESTNQKPTLGIQLLKDLKDLFLEKEKLSTVEILSQLNNKEESPWGDFYKNGLSPGKLASMLKPYGIRPKTMRINTSVFKGYEIDQFMDPWNRYIT